MLAIQKKVYNSPKASWLQSLLKKAEINLHNGVDPLAGLNVDEVNSMARYFRMTYGKFRAYVDSKGKLPRKESDIEK